MAVNDRHRLIQAKVLNVDPLVDKILSDEDNVEKQHYEQACAINVSPIQRRYVEACLLASTDVDRIAELLEIPVFLICMYRDIFYDVCSLNKLRKLELLDLADREDQLMKVWALSQGLDFIEWRLGKTVNTEPIEGLQSLFTLSMYKTKEAMFSGNSSEASKEGAKWAKLSLEMAKTLRLLVQDPNLARKDIELALKSVIPEFEGFSDLDRE